MAFEICGLYYCTRSKYYHCSQFLNKQFLNYGCGITSMYSVCAKKKQILKEKERR